MKYRNQFLKYKLHCQTSPDGGGGGGGGDAGAGAGGDAGTGGDTGGNTGGENNKDGNLLSLDDLWNTEPDAGGNENANGNANAGQQQQQTQQQPNANEQFDAHIGSLDFANGIDINASMEAVRNGDAEGFSKLISQIGANAYRHALVDSNKVIQQRVDKASSTIKSEVNATQATGQLVNQMHETLAFTKSPAYAPVAKLVLTQLLDKGQTPEKAIEGVGQYFKGIADNVNKLGQQAPHARPSGGFNGVGASQNSDGNEGGEIDWLELLGGPPAQ